MKNARWARKWSDAEVLRTLEEEGRAEDVALWKKCRDHGWSALEGGNVVFIDGSEESQRLNEKNEQYRLSRIHHEFGFITINLQLLPRELFESLKEINDNG